MRNRVVHGQQKAYADGRHINADRSNHSVVGPSVRNQSYTPTVPFWSGPHCPENEAVGITDLFHTISYGLRRCRTQENQPRGSATSQTNP
jgi:hypothetical protein